MDNINIILSEKTWNANLIKSLEYEFPNFKWIFITDHRNFSLDRLNLIQPKKIFIPHWSYFIPEEIFSKYECIVFHMTDLPYGRGGSPLQNLIVRGYSETKISALRVVKEMDAGDIYTKEPLSLMGTAEEIFIRANKVIEKMIHEIILKNIKPKEQKGTPVIFKRRIPEMSDISKLNNIEDVFDYIRMLDAEGYPKAFLETENLRFEFNRASLKADKSVIADVRIIKK